MFAKLFRKMPVVEHRVEPDDAALKLQKRMFNMINRPGRDDRQPRSEADVSESSWTASNPMLAERRRS